MKLIAVIVTILDFLVSNSGKFSKLKYFWHVIFFLAAAGTSFAFFGHSDAHKHCIEDCKPQRAASWSVIHCECINREGKPK